MAFKKDYSPIMNPLDSKLPNFGSPLNMYK